MPDPTNIAKLTKQKQDAIQAHKNACLKRYYKSMQLSSAMYIKANMSKSKRILFINKLNQIKNYQFI